MRVLITVALRGGLDGGVLARRLSEQQLLRPDITVERAAHVIVLASFDAYDLRHRSWAWLAGDR